MYADVAELVDALASGASVPRDVEVQVLSSVPTKNETIWSHFSLVSGDGFGSPRGFCETKSGRGGSRSRERKLELARVPFGAEERNESEAIVLDNTSNK